MFRLEEKRRGEELRVRLASYPTKTPSRHPALRGRGGSTLYGIHSEDLSRLDWDSEIVGHMSCQKLLISLFFLTPV